MSGGVSSPKLHRTVVDAESVVEREFVVRCSERFTPGSRPTHHPGRVDELLDDLGCVGRAVLVTAVRLWASMWGKERALHHVSFGRGTPNRSSRGFPVARRRGFCREPRTNPRNCSEGSTRLASSVRTWQRCPTLNPRQFRRDALAHGMIQLPSDFPSGPDGFDNAARTCWYSDTSSRMRTVAGSGAASANACDNSRTAFGQRACRRGARKRAPAPAADLKPVGRRAVRRREPVEAVEESAADLVLLQHRPDRLVRVQRGLAGAAVLGVGGQPASIDERG